MRSGEVHGEIASAQYYLRLVILAGLHLLRRASRGGRRRRGDEQSEGLLEVGHDVRRQACVYPRDAIRGDVR